jgi:hypothetical protein
MLIFALGIGFIAGFIVVAGVQRVLEVGRLKKINICGKKTDKSVQ